MDNEKKIDLAEAMRLSAGWVLTKENINELLIIEEIIGNSYDAEQPPLFSMEMTNAETGMVHLWNALSRMKRKKYDKAIDELFLAEKENVEYRRTSLYKAECFLNTGGRQEGKNLLEKMLIEFRNCDKVYTMLSEFKLMQPWQIRQIKAGAEISDLDGRIAVIDNENKDEDQNYKQLLTRGKALIGSKLAKNIADGERILFSMLNSTSGDEAREILSFNQTDNAFHNDLIFIDIIDRIIELFNPRHFIETGTFLGWSTELIAQKYPNLKIWTTETNKEFYEIAFMRLSLYENVKQLKQSSDIFLNEWLPGNSLGESCLFFLDAHWEDHLPLTNEIKAIAGSACNAVIIVDDFKVPGHESFGYDDYGEGRVCSLDAVLPYLNDGCDYHCLLPKYEDKHEAKNAKHLRGRLILFQNCNELFDKMSQDTWISDHFYSDDEILDQLKKADDSRSSQQKKVVALIPARNEQNTIELCLKAAARFCDAICVFDDASDDSTLEIITGLAQECNIERIIQNKEWKYDETLYRQELLNAGREIGGTHFIVIDADEIFTSNLASGNILKNQIHALQPGDSLKLVWIQLWRSTDYYRFDSSVWTNNYKAFIFADDGQCSYHQQVFHLERVPQDLRGVVYFIEGYQYGLMHFQFVNWRNLLVKQAWYRCLEHINDTLKPVQIINETYGASKDERGLALQPAQVEWFNGYEFFDKTLFNKPEEWREKQVIEWFEEYGREYFKDLDIWDIDWNTGFYPEDVLQTEYIPTETLQADATEDSPANVITSSQEDEYLVSAIVSTYNSEKFILGCLVDLAEQTLYKKGQLEIVVVNSNSSQGEDHIITEFMEHHQHIKYIRTVHRETLYKAWNRGIRVAAGKYITNANSDDRHRPDALEIMADYLDKNNDVSLVYADQLLSSVPNDKWEETRAKKRWGWPPFSYEDLERRCIIGPQPLWKRSLHEKYGYFREDLFCAGDYEFWLRIGNKENIHYIDEILGIYYENNQGLELSTKRSEDETWKIWHEYGTVERGVIPVTTEPVDISRDELNCLPYRRMKDQPKVSVIIPTLGTRPEYLERAIKSVLAQTYKNFEIIVINDGGSPDVENLINKLNQNSTIKYLRHETNRERSAARNTGLAAAKGKYIAYLDDDDIYYPEHLQTLVSFLDVNKFKIAYTDGYQDNQEIRSGKYESIVKEITHSQDFNRDMLLVGNFLPILCLMHEKECLTATGTFDESLTTHEDYDLLIRLAQFYDFAHIPKATCEYTWRTDGTTTTSAKLPEMAETLRRIYEKTERLVEHRQDIGTAREQNLKFMLMAAEEQKIKQNYTQSINEPEELPSTNLDPVHYQHRLENIVNKAGHKYKITVIIPVYNKIFFTSQCLTTLFRNTPEELNYEILVIDNGSNDGTYEYLQKKVADRSNFRFIHNDTNLGYGTVYNQGIRAANSEYVLLLKNDTLPQAGWLDALVKELDYNEQVAIAGSLLLYPNGDIIQHTGVTIGIYEGKLIPYHQNKLRSLENVPQALEGRDMPAVTGTCMLIRCGTLDKIGLFDEEYESLEDIDLCMRALNAGYRIRYCPQSRIVYYETQNEDKNRNDLSNLERFHQKWFDRIQPEEESITRINLFDLWSRETLQAIPADTEALEKLLQIAEYRKCNSEITEYKALLNVAKENKSDEALSFIIPTRNNIKYTKQCLEAIHETCSGLNYEVIIVDNASNDETRDYLFAEQIINDHINIIYNDKNESYAHANNQGAAVASGKFLVFMNNDVIMLPGCPQAIVETFKSEDRIGIQGGKLLYPNGLIQHAGMVYGKIKTGMNLHYHIYLTQPDDAPYVNKPREYQIVTGALLAIRKNIFVNVHGFDEKYHFGHEDMDLCMAVRKAGYKVWYNPKAEAVHFESMTKKLEGIEKFERFITHPNSYDAANDKYFHSKWGNDLKVDADKYYIEDGMYGLISEQQLQESYMKRFAELINALTQLIQDKRFDEANQVLQIISDRDLSEIDQTGKIELPPVPEAALIAAEKLISRITIEEKNIPVIEAQTSINTIQQRSSSPKRILYTMYGWNESGGGTIMPKSMAKELAKRNCQVAVFYASLYNDKRMPPYSVHKDISSDVHLYGIYNRPVPFTDPDNPEREIYDYNVIKHFRDVISEFKPDIIHFHNFLGLSFGISQIARQQGIPTVYTPHNYHLIDPMLYMFRNDGKKWFNTDFFSNSELNSLYPKNAASYRHRQNEARRLINENVDYTLSISERVRELLGEFGANQSKIAIVHQFPAIVDKLSSTKSTRDELHKPVRLGFIGSIIPHKGVNKIINALNYVTPGTVEVYIHGSGPEPYIEKLRDIKTQNPVKWMGAFHDADLPSIAEQLDAMIVPSIWEEGAGLVNLESLAIGLPVIGANIGGIPDFIMDGVNGLLYKYDSEQDLANAINKLVENPDLLLEMQARTNVPLGFTGFMDHIETIYDSLIAGERPPADNFNLVYKELLK